MSNTEAGAGKFEEQQLAMGAATLTPGTARMEAEHRDQPADPRDEASRRADLYMALVQSGIAPDKMAAKVAEMEGSGSQLSK